MEGNYSLHELFEIIRKLYIFAKKKTKQINNKENL